MAHTPGPWTAINSWVINPEMQDAEPVNQNFYKGQLIAESIFTPADARLISAAPELLEALKAMKRYFLRDDTLDRGPWPEGPNDRIKELFIMARDAIAKAEAG